MVRASLVGFALALAACGGPAPCDDCADAGGRDASTADAGSPDPDAGADAGPARTCPPGPVAPEPFDCTTSDPELTFGERITAPDRTWTFVEFPDAFCMDGSPTGIGVSIAPSSDQLVIYLEGGGACFDLLSCAGVANPNGFDARDFASMTRFLDRGLFDRADESNPLRDASFVYVPYCTGDVHGGTNEAGPMGRMHVGYRNVTAFLRRIVPTFPSVTRVLLTGRSAGGLGAIVNFDQVQRAFDCTPVDVLDDGGALLPDEYLKPCLQARVREVWGLDAVVPADCPQCTCSDGGGLFHVFAYLARRHPERRIGLVTSVADGTFRSFYSYGYSPGCDLPSDMPAADFEAGLVALREALADDDGFGTFYVPGQQHTFTYAPLSATSVGGVTLAEWIEQLWDGDPAWGHVGP